ncbi:MAG: helix-turn-helix domain-containing protein [Dehalococcoidales bacterium]|nr:helix-turn-helix domain-containing protein [Dehalococcoidales bacterium]
MRYDISLCNNDTQVLSADLKAVRRKVANVLLHFTGMKGTPRHLSQNELAKILGTSWDMINHSLLSLREEGAITVDRNRLAINRGRLEQIIVREK